MGLSLDLGLWETWVSVKILVLGVVGLSMDLGFVGHGFESRSWFLGVGGVCFLKLGFVWGAVGGFTLIS